MFKRSLLVAMLTAATAVVQAAPLTKDNGAPVGDNQNSITAGEYGSVLLQDVQLVQKLQRFGRERIPERVVHARGTGAYGEFVATKDLSDLTIASLFKAGTKTPVFLRFSTVIHPKGSPETLRDPHGFGLKFYTQEGNWDLVGNNLPVFFIRDAIKFPDFIHAMKPSPVSNVQDANRVFDFLQSQPWAVNMLTYVYSNLGTPASYRNLDGFGVHAFKLYNAKGEYKYVKFNFRTQQGLKGMNMEETQAMQAKDFNHLTNDLYNTINAGKFPKWDLYIQVLDPKDLDNFDFNPLDATKIWPSNLIPETKVGTLTLNRMPKNFFNETEQSAFAPGNLVPGIEPSEDRLLQGRIFSYSDTQMYRLGANHQQIPVNRPLVSVNNNNQEGFMNMSERDSDVNYEPSLKSPKPATEHAKAINTPLGDKVLQQAIQKEQPFKQAGELYRSYSALEKTDLIRNLAADLGQVKDAETKHIMLSYFYKADADYGTRLTKAVNGDLKQVQAKAAKLKD
ncbi:MULTISPECIES: catalase [unclassified Acinetobacter]|uniref:catalase n=1 Tax=unclassified Acinetobacter TaxID=196816 RepID=UPI002574D4D8|nr:MULTISPECIES: catalase [unclassified Acinetobacter]MDM1765516.1 catalase [Acinetobacter sp. 226-1]MDM1769108.1 catalase [Acinetobacter sp. 226-4]